MASRTMPFGYPRGYVAQAPAPLTGMTRTPTGYSEIAEFENGGAAVSNSAGKHQIYGMSFNGDASKLDGIKIFQEFASGLWGRGLLYFSDPMAYDQNLMPPHWATPHLSEHGWKVYSDGVATYSDATPNAYLPYTRQCTLTFPSGTVQGVPIPTNNARIQRILIPPTHKLWLGFKGTATSGAVVRIRRIPIGGGPSTSDAVIDWALISPTSPNQMDLSVDGATYQAVEFYLYSTITDAVVTLRSATAQLWPRAITPVLTGRHIPGRGHTGVRFGDAAIPETYKMVRGHKMQLTTTLVEVGAWLSGQ